jgi:hypothetical protein
MTTLEIKIEILRHLIAHGHREHNAASIDDTFSHLHNVFGMSKDEFNLDAKEPLLELKYLGATDKVMWFTGAGKDWFEQNVLEPEKAQRLLDERPIAKPSKNILKDRMKRIMNAFVKIINTNIIAQIIGGSIAGIVACVIGYIILLHYGIMKK